MDSTMGETDRELRGLLRGELIIREYCDAVERLANVSFSLPENGRENNTADSDASACEAGDANSFGDIVFGLSKALLENSTGI
jgi:hypothetical protein